MLYEFFSCVEFEDGSLQFDAGAGADQTVYLAVVRFGSVGAVYRETKVERSDLKKSSPILSGNSTDPIRVIAFNTVEHWSEDVSECFEIQARCVIGSLRVPDHILGVDGKYIATPGNWSLRLM
jgi:hypothetical protein